ncbi:MAG: fasciclin domain-containing protein [Anaerolineae bacterium]|nr:fasciclin domain-containing protein [Anaerolineae bacterium]
MRKFIKKAASAALLASLLALPNAPTQALDILPPGTYVYAVAGAPGNEVQGCFRVTGYDAATQNYYGEYVGPTCPNTGLTSVRGTAFIDSNMNGRRDVGEATLGHAYYKITDGGGWFTCGNVGLDGSYGVPTTSDNLIVMPIAPPGYKTTTPYIRTTAGGAASLGNDMGFIPDTSAKLDGCDQYNPPRAGLQNVPNTLRSYNTFTQLLAAAEKAGLLNALTNGEYTIFAPTDVAFQSTSVANLSADQLTAILNNHIVKGRYDSAALNQAQSLKTLSGRDLGLQNGGQLKINGVNVVRTNLNATNGVIHAIDAVIR